MKYLIFGGKVISEINYYTHRAFNYSRLFQRGILEKIGDVKCMNENVKIKVKLILIIIEHNVNLIHNERIVPSI